MGLNHPGSCWNRCFLVLSLRASQAQPEQTCPFLAADGSGAALAGWCSARLGKAIQRLQEPSW